MLLTLLRGYQTVLTTRTRAQVGGRRALIQYMIIREQQRQSLLAYLTRMERKKVTDQIAAAELSFQTKAAQAKELVTSNMYSVLLAEI